MATLAATRIREDTVDVRWVLFIDGIRYQFTTDTGQGLLGTLRGSGASSWIGLSETAIGGVEAVGQRTVLGGLEVPPTIRESLDVKAGELEPNPCTFRLHDTDGVLGPLFSREGKTYDILRARLAPGVAATAATTIGPAGGVIDLWDRNVGIERIGPAGERRMFPALPFDLVGFDHAVHQDGPQPGELPPVLVSDEPLAWAGRMVALYEIYRDPDSALNTAAAWPTWDLQHAAGNLAWVGVVRGVSRQRGRVYELDCHGRDAMMKRQLGTVTTGTWMPITAELVAGEYDQIAIHFSANFTSAIPDDFDGSVFDRTLTATTKTELIAEIDGFISDVVDGTSTNTTGTDGQVDAWTVAATLQDGDGGLSPDGYFWAHKVDMAANQSFLEMGIAMHSTRWRQLGYEPETQNYDGQHEAPTDFRQIKFTELTEGAPFMHPYDTGEVVPGPGYWLGRFPTVALGATQAEEDSNEWDNDGANRVYQPKFHGEVFSLDTAGNGQIVRLGGDNAPYIEGQLTCYHAGDDVDGNASERARIFALRGKIQHDPEEDAEDTVQLVLGEFADGNHGSVSVGATGVQPAVRVVKWLDPRTFGFNHKPLYEAAVEESPFKHIGKPRVLSHWMGTNNGEGTIEAVPLHAYAYQQGNEPEFAHSVLTQVWLSTGSGGGYNIAGNITDGDNSPGALIGPLFWGSDLELADLGLAIPHQLVAPLGEIRQAFDTVPGGWAGPLNRVRYAYVGPFLAQDLIGSILRPRRLMMRIHADLFSVVALAPFPPGEADLTISERDLYDAEVPEQLPAPVGHLDGIRLGYRWDPAADRTQLEHVERSRDPDARSRTGELVEDIEDHGLMPVVWGANEAITGVPPWYEEIRQLWSIDAATFYGLEHFSIRLNVSRPKGQDCKPGTRVLVNNPWPVDSAGEYGIVNHVGIITAVDIDRDTHARMVEVFVFAGQSEGYPYFAPSARILDQAGAVLTISTDQYGHGNANIHDGQGLTEPSWSTIGGAAVVRILYRIGATWTLGGTHTVVSYSAGTLTLGSAPATNIEYADRWVILANYDAQDANEYPRTLFGAIVQEDLTHGTGPTAGRPFQP